MEKLLVMQIAAQLTQAACNNIGPNLQVDPELQDNTVRAKNLHVYNVFQVMYHGVLKALDNPNYPMPEGFEAGKLLPSLIESLTPLLQTPGVQDIVQRLLGAIPTFRPVPDQVVPNPGEEVSS